MENTEKFEGGEVYHMDNEGLLQEEYGRLSLEVMTAQGEDKEKIESRMKEIEAQLDIKEAA